MILEFQGNYRFLSNFYPSPIKHLGMRAGTVEHAYQAAKMTNLTDMKKVINCPSPILAKRTARRLKLREDWDEIKIDIMFRLLLKKFHILAFKTKLLATEDSLLIEGNKWGDQFWGFSRGSGKNILGLQLMKVRAILREDSLSDITAFDGRMKDNMKNWASPLILSALKAKGF